MDEFDYSPNLPDVETRTNLYRGLLEHLDKTVFGEKFDLPQSESGQYTAALNPIEAFDKEKFPEGAIFSEPDTKWTESQIRGLPSKLAKIVRKAMQNELKARGPAPFNPSTMTAEQRLWRESGGNPYDTLPDSFIKKYGDDIAAYKEGGNTEAEALKTMLKYGAITPEDVPFAKIGIEGFEGLERATGPMKEADVTSRLLRGSWYRGQDQYPSQARVEKVLDPSTGKEVEEYVTKQFGKEYGTEAPVFAGLRAKQSNLGEPHGISLSYDPNVSTGFGAPKTLSGQFTGTLNDLSYRGKISDKTYERALELADTQKVSRVMPLYGEAPEGKILQAWKPEHGVEFRAAYADSAREMVKRYPGLERTISNLPPGTSGNEIKEAIQSSGYDLNHFDTSKYKSTRDELNSLMSQKLMERGWKGMLHSPHRYQEYELRMFDPYDVMYIDKRAVNSSKYSNNPMSSKAVRRLDEMKSALKREHETVTEDKSKTLADWYRDITREEILGLPKASNSAINDSIASNELNNMLDNWGDDIAPKNVDWDKVHKSFSKKSDNVLEDAQQALKEFYGDTGHGDMADKVQTTAAQLEWGKLNKIKQDAYGTYKQYFGKHSSYDDFTDIWKIFSSNPNAVTFDEFLKQY